MRGSVRLKGKTWSYRIELGVVEGKRKQIESLLIKSQVLFEKSLKLNFGYNF